MFVTRSRYNSDLRLLELAAAQRETLYQNQIRILEDRISDLRKLVFSPPSQEPTPEMHEVDQILTPVNDSPIVDYEQETDDILRERDRIFSGEYDQVN